MTQNHQLAKHISPLALLSDAHLSSVSLQTIPQAIYRGINIRARFSYRILNRVTQHPPKVPQNGTSQEMRGGNRD